MLKLILHHEYSTGDGVAVDTSDHGNHGVRAHTTFLAAGHEPYSGALTFNGVSSRVTVRHNPTIKDLGSLKVEAWINPSLVDQRRNIIEGDDSFAVYLTPSAGDTTRGILHGDFRDTGGTWVLLSSEPPYAPGGKTSAVHTNTWSKITYFHDGIASAVLLINDTIVAERYDLKSAVGSVGSRDLIVGSWTLDDRYSFLGSIDEVKVWKEDPDELEREFFCRFKDAKALKCLNSGYKRWLSNLSPQKVRQIEQYIKCQNHIVEDIIRTVYSHGRQAKETWEKFHQRYLELWCKNKASSPRMKELMEEWAKWLCELVGPDTVRKWIRQVTSCQGEYHIDTDPALLKIWKECDPDFVSYIDLFVKAWSRCIKADTAKGGRK